MTLAEKINADIIISEEDVFSMLDGQLSRADKTFWDRFYANRTSPIPFFVNDPDENLIGYVGTGMIGRGKALDIGCGAGRNSSYLARNGFATDGIDLSDTAISWAKERASSEEHKADFRCISVFEYDFPNSPYDLIYDSGVLHHIYPHRRPRYLSLVTTHLKSRGFFGLTCFNLEGGSPLSDLEVYEKHSMEGGIAFTREKIERLFENDFELIEFRTMKDADGNGSFGRSFMNTALFRKRS